MLLVALGCSLPLGADEASASDAHGPGSELRDGFVVARGTKLVGAVFPEFVGENGPSSEPHGWFALLEVNTDATTVIDRYSRQARDLGYKAFYPAGRSNVCSQSTAGNVWCSASYRGVDSVLDVLVHVCRSCRQPIANASLRTYPLSGSADFGEAPLPLPAGTATARLDPSERARARRQPEEGDQLFPLPDQFPYTPIDVLHGTRVLARTHFGTCERDFVAVLALTGSPPRLLRRYARAAVGSTPPRSNHARFRGLDATMAGDGYWTVTLLEGKRLSRPLLKIDWCG